MQIKKLLPIFSIFVLTSCADLVNQSPFKWRPYLDIDGSTQYMDFFHRVLSNSDKQRIDVSYGTVIKKVKFGDMDTYSEIGDFYPLIVESYPNNAMGSVFIVEKKSLNPYSSEIDDIKTAKMFDFYEFGNSLIGHSQFSSPKGLCEAFKSKQGVKVSIATSYYHNYDNYYASQIKATLLSNREIRDIEYTPHFYFSDQKLEQKIKEQERENGRKIVESNLQEKFSLLVRICK